MLKNFMLRSALIAIACALSVTAHAYAADARHVEIPAGDLTAALELLARQSGVELVYQTEQVKGLRTPGATGKLSAEQAVAKLLQGTNLTFKTDASGAMLIGLPSANRNSATVEQGAEVSRPPSAPQTLDRAEAQEPDAASSQSDSPTPAPQAPRQDTAEGTAGRIIGEVVVTGSRLKRADTEGPSPVLVLTREGIERSGAATTREVLNTITQNAVARDESGNATFLGASTVQLRGLPVGTTLMLLNGRRLGASGAQVSANFFDLNNLPLEAVERIEVFLDSASAIYGADAVGGAVNLILRKDFDGVGAGVRFGTSSEGDADERNASLTWGGKGESLSGLLVLDFFDRDPLHGADRRLASTFDLSRFDAAGTDFRETTAYPANVWSADFFTPLPGLTTPFAATPAGTDGIGLTPADFVATDGTLGLFDPGPFQTVQAEANRKSVYASGRFSASPGFGLFAEVLHTHREQIMQHAPGTLSFSFVPATNPFNPFGEDVFVEYRLTELGPGANDTTTDFSRFVLGAEGELRSFDWQVYALADEDSSDLYNRGDVDGSSVVEQFLNSTDPNVALNVFSTTGNNNPQTLAAILAASPTDELATRSRMAEAVARGPLFDLPAGSMSVVLGVNARREKVDFRSESTGITIGDTHRTSAVFAEASLPLASAAQGIPAIHSLELTAAIRHDDNSAFDSSTNPQFGLMWRPVSSLLLRGSYGEAFKAPSTFHLALLPVQIPFFPALDPLRGNELSVFEVNIGGNPDLKPEIGESWSAGLVWEPGFARGFFAAFNGFRLQQDDFITVVLPSVILANEDLFPGRVARGPPDPADPPGFAGPIISVDSSFANFGRLTVKGADAQLRYMFPQTAYGQFVASLAGTYIDEYEILVTPGLEPTNEVNTANQAGYPVRFKGNAGISWNGLGGWSANVTTRYLNSYTDYDGARELPAQTWVDLQLGRRFDSSDTAFIERLEASLGVNNLTDNQGEFSNNFGYDPVHTDLRGRFYYATLKMKF